MKRFSGFLAAACWAAVAASGAYLEGEAERSAVDPLRPSPPGAPPPAAMLPALAQAVTVGAPLQWSHLSVYPLELRMHHGGMGILTLDQAMQGGHVVIREVGGGQVSRLAVRNDAFQPVFLMAGELVLGGKQNRMVRDDVLLESRSGWREIEVYCGEQHRWRESGGFESGETLSSPSLRKMAAGRADQDRIWGEIGAQLEAAEVTAPTANYQQLFQSPEQQRRLDACVERLRPLPGPGTVGCVVVSGGRVVGCDLFSDPHLFAALWPKLCRSFGADMLTPPPMVEHHRGRIPPPDHQAVRLFLDAISRARYSHRATPGIGSLWGLEGTVEGTSLEHFGGVVHAGLFSVHLMPHPMPMPSYER